MTTEDIMPEDSDSTESEVFASIQKKKRGGARPGSGRPVGSKNKISSASLLESINQVCGKPFESLIAEAYKDSIDNKDTQTRLAYDKLFMSKLVNDQIEIVTSDVDSDKISGFTIVPIKLAKKVDE